MNKKMYLGSLLAGTLYGGAVDAERPNVLLIVVDDLNVYQGIYGAHPQAQTPNLDRLAADSVIFNNAHSPAPLCAPARPALFHGILPHRSGVMGGGPAYRQSQVMADSKLMMHHFRDNGYRTVGAGKLMHHFHPDQWCEHRLRQQYGPQAFNGVEPVPHPAMTPEFGALGIRDGTFASLADVPSVPPSADAPGYTGWWVPEENRPFRYVHDDDRDLMHDEQIAEWAVEQIERFSNEPEPFLIGVGFYRPHTPLIAPQRFFDLYPLESLQRPPNIKEGDADDTYFRENIPQHKGFQAYSALHSFPDFDEALLRYVQAYLACVSFVDEQIGKVIEALNRSPLRDNTIVILTSDHGYNLGEKEVLFKNTLWQESTQVPFLVRVPGNEAQAGQRVHAPISLIDIYPTLVDYCQLEGDTVIGESGLPLCGHSLRPLLENPTTGIWNGPDVALTVVRSWGAGLMHYAVRGRDWRYIRYADGSEELYDHRVDPAEWNNLAADPEHKVSLKKMRRLMDEQIQ